MQNLEGFGVLLAESHNHLGILDENSFWGSCILQTKLTLFPAFRPLNWALVASFDPSFPEGITQPRHR